MPKLNPSNRLYLYQLFSREIGFNRQTRADTFEDVLAADGLTLRDLGVSDVSELAGQLDDFCKLTVFKGGRVFVTLTANEEFDQALSKAAAGAKKGSKPGKSFKRPKAVKSAKPVKPRHIEEQPEEAAEPAAEEAPAEAEANTAAASDAGSTAPAGANEEKCPERAAAEEPGQTKPQADELDSEAAAGQPDNTETTAADPVATDSAQAASINGAADQTASDAAASIDSPSASDDAAHAEAVSAEPPAPEPKQAPGHRKIELTITYDPYEGLDEEADAAQQERAEDQPEAPAASAATAPEAPAAPAAPAKRADDEREAAAETREAAASASGHARQSRAAEPAPRKPEPSSAEGASRHAAHHDDARPHRHERHDQAALRSEASAHVRHEQHAERPDAARAASATPLTPAHDPDGRPLVKLMASHPGRLSDGVRVSDDQLARLYALLPFNAEPLDELDRGWRRARSCGLMYGAAGEVTFALGYRGPAATRPATVTIKHVAKMPSGKSWVLESIDTHEPDEAASDAGSFEEHPARLVPLGADTPQLDTLCSLICLGGWDHAAELLRQALPQATAAELRAALPPLVSAVAEQQAFVTTKDGARAAFALPAAHGPVYALLDRRPHDDIAWTLSGFALPGSSRLAVLPELPGIPCVDPTLKLG